eukprot:scaffold130950_cov29-Tisochrysis_lutea.AAC.2
MGPPEAWAPRTRCPLLLVSQGDLTRQPSAPQPRPSRDSHPGVAARHRPPPTILVCAILRSATWETREERLGALHELQPRVGLKWLRKRAGDERDGRHDRRDAWHWHRLELMGVDEAVTTAQA